MGFDYTNKITIIFKNYFDFKNFIENENLEEIYVFDDNEINVFPTYENNKIYFTIKFESEHDKYMLHDYFLIIIKKYSSCEIINEWSCDGGYWGFFNGSNETITDLSWQMCPNFNSIGLFEPSQKKKIIKESEEIFEEWYGCSFDDYNRNNILELYYYENDIEILDISNKNITGILDLKRFKNLKELYCQNNEITKIININPELNIIHFQRNLITEFENRLYHLTEMCFSNNPLKKLYYPLNAKPLKFPKYLEYLTFGKYYNYKLDNLPDTLIYLKLSCDYNKRILHLPESLTHLIFGCRFNKSIENLPNNLTHLTFGMDFNKSFNKLPENIKYLKFGYDFDKPVDCLEEGIKELIFDCSFNQNIDNLPDSIEYLEFGYDFNQPFEKLPNNLKKLIFGESFNKNIEYLPENIEYLKFGYDFDKNIESLIKNIDHVEFGENYNS